MIYVIYVFGGVFILLAAAMLFAFHREKHFGFFLMGVTYATSGIMALALPHWWPLVAGFVLAWMLRMLGLEEAGGARDESEAVRDEGAGRDEGRAIRDEGRNKN